MLRLGQKYPCWWALAPILFLVLCFFLAQGGGSTSTYATEEVKALIAGERLGP